MALKSALLGASVDKAGIDNVSALAIVFKTDGEESKAATLRSVFDPSRRLYEVNMKCPKCEAPLIKRQGQQWEEEGQDCLVCSRYPKCSYKKLYKEKKIEVGTLQKMGQKMGKKYCERCGAELVLKKRLSGEKENHRYWVCSQYPKCTFRKMYAEEGKALGPWQRLGKMFVRS